MSTEDPILARVRAGEIEAYAEIIRLYQEGAWRVVASLLQDEYKEARFAPPSLLRRMMLAGFLGRKSGKGFYDYGQNPPVPNDALAARRS